MKKILPLILALSLLACSVQKRYCQTNNVEIARINKKSLQDKFVENAKSYLGTPYIWDGRRTKNLPGLDCMGLVFKAYEKTTGKSWKKLSPITTKLISKNQLGKPVDGLRGILKDSIDYSKLQKGDIVHFLVEGMVNGDSKICEINGKEYYAYHLGIYEGDSSYIHANPGDKVTEQRLDSIFYPAIFVTRPFE